MSAKIKPSPTNICPFLRAMTAYGHLKEKAQNLFDLSAKLSSVSGETREKGRVPKTVFYFVALIANGFSPCRLSKSVLFGVDLDLLRGGPLDKRGAGSRIIGANGTIDAQQLERLDAFALDVVDPETQQPERGLTLPQITKMMDENFKRAEGHRRKIDRSLMNGEWPVLLRIMGKGLGDARYLALSELRTFFVSNELPERVTERLRARSQ